MKKGLWEEGKWEEGKVYLFIFFNDLKKKQTKKLHQEAWWDLFLDQVLNSEL